MAPSVRGLADAVIELNTTDKGFGSRGDSRDAVVVVADAFAGLKQAAGGGGLAIEPVSPFDLALKHMDLGFCIGSHFHPELGPEIEDV